MSDNLKALRASAVLCVGLTLLSCQVFRDASSISKHPPDEFVVATNPPLAIPPDFNLRAPQKGAPPRYAFDSSRQAQSALFPLSASPQSEEIQTAMRGAYSDGENLLLRQSNALSVDPDIRRIVTAEAGLSGRDKVFTEKVLFGDAGPEPKTLTAVAVLIRRDPEFTEKVLFADTGLRAETPIAENEADTAEPADAEAPPMRQAMETPKKAPPKPAALPPLVLRAAFDR